MSDYRNTLNITLNDKDPGAFPQRANLPTKEPEIQARWDALDVYKKSVAKPSPRGKFILHDGPPYSNGNIHLGHALNKIAKDITTRFRTMQGYQSPYVPGWDNHGMPIENAVAKKFREDKRIPDRVELRRACREYAAQWVETQKEQFKRLGIRGDWHDPYLTMSRDFEAKIVEVFGELAERGFIYRGLKPVFWCGTCETALADAEVEYEPHVSNSIYVRFPLHFDPNGVFNQPASEPNTQHPTPNAYAVIWTTTPWTIPANVAIAAHPEAEYAVVRLGHVQPMVLSGGETGDIRKPFYDFETAYYLVAVPLIESVMKVLGVHDARSYEVVKTVRGADLAGLTFRHPLFDRTSTLVLADYVTMDTGTGLVHTAPGHGKEDFETGVKYGLEVLNPVDAAGRYTAAAGEFNETKFEGLRVTTFGNAGGKDAEANVALIEALKQSGNLLSATKYEHSYPHCWRCHSPLIFRATVQWFMNIDHDGFRQKALAAIETVTWFPKESVNRINSMVGGRPDWCVSRQRSWGVGIPAFYCDSCGEAILEKASVAAVVALVEREGSDAWYEKSATEILPPDCKCPKCGSGPAKLRKETDVLDVWFDSGSTHRAVLQNPAHWPDLQAPADVYLEGGDQHRGWFNSSLMISVGAQDRAPYRQVVTNGWTLDEHGHAMHKSLGNVIDPLKIVAKDGADVVRLWVASQNFMEDTRCGDNLLKQVSEMYRRIRNTFRFLVNNIHDFDPETDSVPYAEMEELDRWVVNKLRQLTQTATTAYENYEFHRVYQAALNFCSTELSAFYLDVVKDRLYASGKDWKTRRSAQTALHLLTVMLAKLLAPILVHTCEEVWDYVKLSDKAESVHLADFPASETPDAELLARWDKLLALRDEVKGKLEEARSRNAIGNPLEACVAFTMGQNDYEAFGYNIAQMPVLMLGSQVAFDVQPGLTNTGIEVRKAEGVKCGRCWLVKTDIGADSAHPEICERCAKAFA